jgi:hypothetical protein
LKQLPNARTDSPDLTPFLTRRAEELSVKEFLELYHLVY